MEVSKSYKFLCNSNKKDKGPYLIHPFKTSRETKKSIAPLSI